MSKEHKPEREVWIFLLGACLGGKQAQAAVFDALSPEDFGEDDLRELAQAIKGSDGKGVAELRLSLEKWGVVVNGKPLESLVDKGKRVVLNRRLAYELSRMGAASKCQTTVDLEKFVVESIERLSAIVATKGRTQ